MLKFCNGLSLSESAQKACISVEFVLNYLEYFREVIHLSDSSLKDIMINDPEKSLANYKDKMINFIKYKVAENRVILNLCTIIHSMRI